MNRVQMGPLFVAISAVLYSLGGLFIKLIPWSGVAINGGRSAIALLVTGAYMIAVKHPLRFNRWILLGALCVFGNNALFSVANKLTTAANAIVLQFTMPIFVILFSFLFFKKKPGGLDGAACVGVCGGIVFFFLDSLEMGGGLGNVIALISGVVCAGVYLMDKMPDSDALSSVFWGDVLSAITGLPFLFLETDFSPGAIVNLVILGAFQMGAAYVFLCIGLKTTPPIMASLVAGIEPVLNPILVAVFYGEYVGPFALAGAVIVIGSIVAYNVLQAKKQQQDSQTDLRINL